jgi:hypothetical protein
MGMGVKTWNDKSQGAEYIKGAIANSFVNLVVFKYAESALARRTSYGSMNLPD